eukprot:350126-Chlamydomonas_euryale.AAC.2
MFVLPLRLPGKCCMLFQRAWHRGLASSMYVIHAYDAHAGVCPIQCSARRRMRAQAMHVLMPVYVPSQPSNAPG